MSIDGSNAVLTEEEEFLALLCADEELLRAEFDAIIAELWPGTPGDPPGDAADERAAPALRSSSSGCQRKLPNRPRYPGVAEGSRQRSPPAARQAGKPASQVALRIRGPGRSGGRDHDRTASPST
jgi:hypothetical protein